VCTHARGMDGSMNISDVKTERNSNSNSPNLMYFDPFSRCDKDEDFFHLWQTSNIISLCTDSSVSTNVLIKTEEQQQRDKKVNLNDQDEDTIEANYFNEEVEIKLSPEYDYENQNDQDRGANLDIDTDIDTELMPPPKLPLPLPLLSPSLRWNCTLFKEMQTLSNFDVCDKTFSSRKTLRVHFQKAHNLYFCNFLQCSKFIPLLDKHKHMQKYHKHKHKYKKQKH